MIRSCLCLLRTQVILFHTFFCCNNVMFPIESCCSVSHVSHCYKAMLPFYDKVMFPMKSCYSINLSGIVSTHSVHPGFYFCPASATVLFYLIHCFLGYTVQTLIDSLWGVDCLVCKLPYPKIHHRRYIDGVPIHTRNFFCLTDLGCFK